MSGTLGLFGTAHLRWRGVDPLVRTMIVNWIGGMMVGLLCASLLLAFDVLGIGTLLWSSESFVVAAVTLFASFAFTFGGVVCAAVMNFDAGDDVPRRGRRPRAKISLGPLLSTLRGR
jgi:hypothetical protein